MGSSPRAYLAYGYDLGGGEEHWRIKEYDAKNYDLQLDWYKADDRDEDEETESDFVESAKKRLLASVGFTEEWTPNTGYWERLKEAEERVGVEFDRPGHSDYPGGYIVYTDRLISAAWGEVVSLDLRELQSEQQAKNADAKLAAAVKALGITPLQAEPRWLLYAYYG